VNFKFTDILGNKILGQFYIRN